MSETLTIYNLEGVCLRGMHSVLVGTLPGAGGVSGVAWLSSPEEVDAPSSVNSNSFIWKF